MIFTSTRVVKMQRIFTNLHGYFWFLLPHLMEKRDPSLVGGESHFKMAGEVPYVVAPTFFSMAGKSKILF